ncbi:MAG: ribosomal protein S18-alanine N-acetyltransferase, partial [Gammaproteobacteria bacterium]|nr:ribosomal protein S18-alanine N-acetyltransferase [Gammaproteobacteria bacterium]
LANKQQIVAHGVMSVAIGECHLLTLCVRPEYQRHGHGRKLFKLLLDRAYKQEAEICFLEARRSNEGAISLYRSMGFVQVGERKNYYPGKGAREDALIMSRNLPLP